MSDSADFYLETVALLWFAGIWMWTADVTPEPFGIVWLLGFGLVWWWACGEYLEKWDLRHLDRGVDWLKGVVSGAS